MKSIFILIILAIFLIGILLWEIWPDGVEIVHLKFKTDQSKQILKIYCRAVDSLLDKQWEIRYPNSINKFETKTVSIVLLDSSPTNSSITGGEPECDIAIEVLLDASSIETSPGSRILEPYQNGSPLRFEWSVQAGDGDTSGTIWIYLLLKEEGEQFSRFPLFALPVEFSTISLMGISPRILRMILFLLIIINSGIYLLIKSNGRE